LFSSPLFYLHLFLSVCLSVECFTWLKVRITFRNEDKKIILISVVITSIIAVIIIFITPTCGTVGHSRDLLMEEEEEEEMVVVVVVVVWCD